MASSDPDNWDKFSGVKCRWETNENCSYIVNDYGKWLLRSRYAEIAVWAVYEVGVLHS